MRRLQRHISHLVASTGARRVTVKSYLNASTYDAFGVVAFPPITSHFNYAVALHEIGHLVTTPGFHLVKGITSRGYLRCEEVLEEEEVAWKWARQHAKVWTKEMEEAYNITITSYQVRPLIVLLRPQWKLVN